MSYERNYIFRSANYICYEGQKRALFEAKTSFFNSLANISYL